MSWWERHTEIIFRRINTTYLKPFEENSPEQVLKRSVTMLDPEVLNQVKKYVTDQLTADGGFADKAGKADLYYSVFGCFVAEALGLKEVIPRIQHYLSTKVNLEDLFGVNAHCAAVLSVKCGMYRASFKKKIDKSIRADGADPTAYQAFLRLLTCYYTHDFMGFYRIRRQLRSFQQQATPPCPVQAALLVLEHSFGGKGDYRNDLLSFYTGHGSFKATREAPLPDLLSTGVALYSLSFAGYDLRLIRPDCLEYVDQLFSRGGFMASHLDREPDIEYTFYGLLALGSLAAPK